MFHHKIAGLSFAMMFCGALSSYAQLTISGVADKGIYPNTVSFMVSTQSGYSYGVFLNHESIPAGVATTLNRADYYELSAFATNQATSAVANEFRRFIVQDTSRGSTELGLPSQTPWPVIPSAAQEFDGARLRLISPQDFPVGCEVPVVAWVLDDEGHAVRANGSLAAEGQRSINLKRGVGSGFLAATNPAGPLNYTPSVQGLQTNKTINLESSTTWLNIAGTLSGDTVWPANSRIAVVTNISVPAGSTLTIGEGTMVRLNPRVNITNFGNIIINGNLERPVVFMPVTHSQPWGGFFLPASTSQIDATGTIFTHSGAGQSGYAGHRSEQHLFSLYNHSRLTLTDCAAIYLDGQFGHGFDSGQPLISVNLTRTLVQHGTTGGEYTGASFTVNDSAFIEFPDDTSDFDDGDNDALYLVSGTHGFTNTLFGWTKDDGIDSGGDGVGTLNYQRCWFEETFHEGNSLSGAKTVRTHDTVYLDCGQGLEDGYGGANAIADHCLFLACQSGVRRGDNYRNTYSYTGTIAVTNSLLLHNHRDVFGYHWNDAGWTNSWGQCFASNNLVAFIDTNFPDNSVWNPTTDAARLAAFGGVGRVGVALAIRADQTAPGDFPDSVPVGLSRFCINQVSVDYTFDSTEGIHSSATLVFPPGKMRNYIPLPVSFTGVLRISLVNPVNADLTGSRTLFLQNLSSATASVLSPLGASWRYLDDGSDQGTAWRAPGFNDSTWSNGIARLGFGGDAAATTIIRRYLSGNSGPQFTNYYFRRAIIVTNPMDFAMLQFRYQRDDGCIVYLNGTAVITNNMPPGPATNHTFAATTISGAAETQRFWTNTVSPALLQPGTNVMAAEVHQSTPASSDIAWELEVQGLRPSSPARIAISRLGGDAFLYWSDATFSLQQSDNTDGAWGSVSGAKSPVPLIPGDSSKFFRLRKP